MPIMYDSLYLHSTSCERKALLNFHYYLVVVQIFKQIDQSHAL